MFWIRRKAIIGKLTKWYPCALTIGEPVSMDELGAAIARRCTASPADVFAVLKAMPNVMADFMEAGRSVRLDGFGSFYYKLSCAGRGVDTPEEVSIDQIKAVRVQFVPARSKRTYGFTRSLVQDISFIEWGAKNTEE